MLNLTLIKPRSNRSLNIKIKRLKKSNKNIFKKLNNKMKRKFHAEKLKIKSLKKL
jgi:hypothetical protein